MNNIQNNKMTSTIKQQHRAMNAFANCRLEPLVSKKTANTLLLTLHKAAFDVMASGEKDIEVREKSPWIYSRLFNKDGSKREYKYIKFINGYGKDKPYFICEYKGFDNCNGMNWIYSNGLELVFSEDRWIIYLGQIVSRFSL